MDFEGSKRGEGWFVVYSGGEGWRHLREDGGKEKRTHSLRLTTNSTGVNASDEGLLRLLF
jgi:hypothetical protein